MVIPPYRVFFDTSVYIAALLSPKGGAGELIRLAETKAITMVVCAQVIIESDKVLSQKFSTTLVEKSRELWKRIGPEVVLEAKAKNIIPFSKNLPLGDALILASAVPSQVHAFVTWNTRDFMKPRIKQLVSFPIVTPAECLNLFRKWIEPYFD